MALMSGQSTSFSGELLNLSLEAEVLHFEQAEKNKSQREQQQDKSTRQAKWHEFEEKFLQRVCGARNTSHPPRGLQGRHCPLPQLPRKSWWQLKIALLKKKDHFDYIGKLSDRVDECLHRLLSPRSSYSDVFFMIPGESAIIFEVVSSDKEFATLDYKTKQSTNKGLVPMNAFGLDSICYNLYQKVVTERCQVRERNEELKNLQARPNVLVSEDARLQFKRLQEGQKASKKTETGKNQKEESFDPEKPADHYVDWIWNKFPRGLGEYVSAFCKIEDGGGAVYYGIKEADNHTGYEPVGLAIDAAKMEAIKESICHKIRNEMLWIQRAPDTVDGYRALTPDDIRCQGETDPAQDPNQAEEEQTPSHFAVDFLPVQEPSSAQAKFVLEVRVAPFNGVVFYDPQGPEAYRMEKEGEGFKPVRVSKEEWLSKMRDYGWCSMHKKPKKNDCALCISERIPDGRN